MKDMSSAIGELMAMRIHADALVFSAELWAEGGGVRGSEIQGKAESLRDLVDDVLFRMEMDEGDGEGGS